MSPMNAQRTSLITESMALEELLKNYHTSIGTGVLLSTLRNYLQLLSRVYLIRYRMLYGALMAEWHDNDKQTDRQTDTFLNAGRMM